MNNVAHRRGSCALSLSPPPIVSERERQDQVPDRLAGNELSGLNVSLPVNTDDPSERVRLIAPATSIAKMSRLAGTDAMMGRHPSGRRYRVGRFARSQ